MWLVREREREEEQKIQDEAINGPSKPVEETYEYNTSFWSKIIRNRNYHALLMLFIFAMVVPTLLFYFVYAVVEYDESYTCVVMPEYQIPCGLNASKTTLQKCSSINCCFNDDTHECFHSLPSNYRYTGYSLESGFYSVASKSPFGRPNSPKAYMNFKSSNDDKLSFSLSDKQTVVKSTISIKRTGYEATIYLDEMGIEVKRPNSTDLLLSTTHGPTIISDRYWEWTVDMHTEILFGLDELRFPDNVTTTRVIYANALNHGVVPKFMAERLEQYHGLEIEHDGPLEIAVLPSKLIVVRMLSGRPLTLHLSIGPTPVDVLRQLRSVDPVIPPYWALGVHICRASEDAITIQSALEDFNDFHTEAKGLLAYDSNCLHENIFSFTMDETDEETSIADALDVLKKSGKKFMMSLSSQVAVGTSTAYAEALRMGILYLEQNTSVVHGSYMGNTVVYPDYASAEAQLWVKDTLSALEQKLNTAFDGFVLKDNWPVNENSSMRDEQKFQYLSKDLRAAMSNTLPWQSASNVLPGEHIARHKTYGTDQTKAVEQTKPGLFILSASHDSRNPHGSHAQNLNISWVNYKQMLTSTLSNSLFGNQMHSIPVCGSTSNYKPGQHDSLCLRWYLTSATLPLFRVSSVQPYRDPISLESGHLKAGALRAVKTRYTLLPYIWTVLQENLSIVRPMFFEFYKDRNTLLLDEQYMIGRALLVVQPVLAQLTVLSLYLPEVSGGWYEFWGGTKYDQIGWLRMPVVETDLVIFISAGHIIPLQDNIDFTKSDTAEKFRQEPLSVAVALDCSSAGCVARGSWAISETASLEFEATDRTLRVSNLLQTRDQLCVDRVATNYIGSLRIYKEDELQIHIVNSDLCSTVEDSVDITYPV